MVGDKTKKFTFRKVVKIEDIKVLGEFVEEKYEMVKYSLRTSDDIWYSLDNLDELFNYDNPRDSHIKTINIKGFEDENKVQIIPDLEIVIGEYSHEYTIRNTNEKDIYYLSRKLDSFMTNFKSPNSWISNIWGVWIVSMIITLPIVYTYVKISKSLGINLETYLNAFIAFMVMLPFVLLSFVFIDYFFPRISVLIGAQKSVYEKRQRTLIWIGSLVTTIYLSAILSIVL